MPDNYDLVVSGTVGKDAPNPMTKGVNGDPLGPDGNGAPGESGWFKCKKPAGPGKRGNQGQQAPNADSGGNGGDVSPLTLTCSQFQGGTLSVLVRGGNGGRGGSGGKGGDGSTGGNAGKQPGECTQIIPGGTGGGSGGGGNAGAGGCGGNAADVTAIYGPQLGGSAVSVMNIGGTPGIVGNAGDPGDVGAGGLNSDGTRALDGAQGPGGLPAQSGPPGYGGSFQSSSDPSKPANYLSLSVVPPSSTKYGCGATS